MKYRAEAIDRLGEIYELVFEAQGEKEALRYARSQGLEPERLLIPGRPYDQITWERTPHLFCKWICDGASDLDQAIAQAHGFVEQLEKARAEGMQLEGPVDNGHIFLRRPPGSS